MKVELVKIENLKVAEYNPRKLTSKQEKELLKSLDKFGMVEPIVVNSNKERKNVIIGGHQRFYLEKKRGSKEIPVVYVDLSLDDEKELNLRLNKNNGEWDWELLYGFDKKMLLNVGFSLQELNKIYGSGDNIEGEVKFTEELQEAHNYIVLYFDNEVDWLYLQSLYPLSSVQALDSKDNWKRQGVGRVVKGVEFLKKILGN